MCGSPLRALPDTHADTHGCGDPSGAACLQGWVASGQTPSGLIALRLAGSGVLSGGPSPCLMCGNNMQEWIGTLRLNGAMRIGGIS